MQAAEAADSWAPLDNIYIYIGSVLLPVTVSKQLSSYHYALTKSLLTIIIHCYW